MNQIPKQNHPIGPKAIIIWWEKRRLNLNFLFFTLAYSLYFLIKWFIMDEIHAFMPMWVILEIGIFLNIFYIFIWGTDLLFSFIKKPFTVSFRKYLYKSILGLTTIIIIGFSIVVIFFEKG